MAGNEEAPKTKRKIKTFSCESCGASVTLRNPDSLTIVCPSCNAVLDAQDENYRIITSYNLATNKYKPRIELGTRGELFGKKWEMLGFLVRKDIGSGFMWDEYLLFNPYYGYRWLTEVSGHWSFVRSIKEIPSTDRQDRAVYKNKEYKVFNHGRACIEYVIGEFYWIVERDSEVTMSDYVRPPQMLSSELDRNEYNWSVGEYIEAEAVRDAFKIKKLPAPTGIGANQICQSTVIFEKMLPWWVGFFLLLTFTQLFQVSQNTNRSVLSESMEYIPNTKSNKGFTSKVFELKKDNANLELAFKTELSNSWFYLSGELVNNSNGVTYGFDKSIEHYAGVDDGESWSEGGNSQSLLIPSVPAGQYYLNMDYESGGFNYNNPRILEISAHRDVPVYGNYFWCLFFISILPVLYWLMSRSDEVKRWSNSDYSPYSSSE